MSTPVSTPASIAPLQQVIFKSSDFDDESLTLFNQQFSNVVNLLNGLAGFNGPIKFPNHVDMGGNRLMNVGAAESESDAVSQSFATQNYGAAALSPQIEALGKSVMQTYRRLSDQNQREKYSSFLNATGSTPPASNSSIVVFGPPSGGTVTATVTAGLLQRVDGSVSPYSSRTDTLTLPTSYSIASLTRSGNTVTAVTSLPTGILVGEGFTVTGASDPTFDGTFMVATIISSTSFTYYQGGVNASSSGGSLASGGVFYYTLRYGQTSLGLVSSLGSVDTTSERVGSSRDGTVIIAVVALTASGGDVLNSAAGASPQQAGSTVAILRRL